MLSDDDLAMQLWLMESNGVKQVPSVGQVKTSRKKLEELYGIGQRKYIGTLGHTYYVNNFAKILAQEMANPQVRPYLHFFPEDGGDFMSEARHGRKWLRDVDPDLLTPMVRVDGVDYYVFEPALLKNHHAFMPERIITKRGNDGSSVGPFLQGWEMTLVETQRGHRGWRIDLDKRIDVGTRDLLWNFEQFLEMHRDQELPSPTRIWGKLDGLAAQFAHSQLTPIPL